MVVNFLCFNLCHIFYKTTMPDIGRLSSVALSLITATQFVLSSLFFLSIQNFFQKGEKTKLTRFKSVDLFPGLKFLDEYCV